MTLQELYKEVSQLGFEDSLGDDSTGRFIYAANRALIEIDSLRPRRKRVDIAHRVPANLLSSAPAVFEKVEAISFSAVGAKSFYFEVWGKGAFNVGIKRLVQDSDGKIEEELVNVSRSDLTFDTIKFDPRKGFIRYNEAFIDKLLEGNKEGEYPYYTGEVIITFEGDYAYTVRNLAMYDKVYSDKEADIVPYGAAVGYNVKELVGDDFEKFATPPIDSNGYHLTDGYRIEDSTIYLPADKTGVYTINYLHKVKAIPLDADVSAGSTKTVTIDLEDDLAALLPNLIAAYVWLDDEADKSQYYYNLYLQRAEQIKYNTRNLNPVEFKSVNGW